MSKKTTINPVAETADTGTEGEAPVVVTDVTGLVPANEAAGAGLVEIIRVDEEDDPDNKGQKRNKPWATGIPYLKGTTMQVQPFPLSHERFLVSPVIAVAAVQSGFFEIAKTSKTLPKAGPNGEVIESPLSNVVEADPARAKAGTTVLDSKATGSRGDTLEELHR
jgi:hypothetical protein